MTKDTRPKLSTINIIVTSGKDTGNIEQKEFIEETLKHIMDENGVKKGRALELLCGEYWASYNSKSYE